MSFNLDDANIGGQIKCGTGIFPAIGEGVTRVKWSVVKDLLVIGSPQDSISLLICLPLNLAPLYVILPPFPTWCAMD